MNIRGFRLTRSKPPFSLEDIMSILSELISKYTDLSDVDFITHDILDKVIPVVIYDGDQSIAAIEKVYGQQFAISLVVGMKNILAGLRANGTSTDIATADYLSIYFDRVTVGSGLNFADQTVQDRLDGLALYLTQPVIEKLKALGMVKKSKWEITTSEPEPTQEEISAAVTNLTIKRDAGVYWSRVLAVVNPMIDAGNSAQEIKIAASEVI